jgi:hypothetical protein
MDDEHELQGMAGIMAQVDKVDLVALTVTLKLPDDVPSAGFSWPSYDEKSTNHPLLRRWDHRAMEGVTLYQGAILITESNDRESGWIEIENGIEVQFQHALTPLHPRQYRTGDYWFIPARVVTGKIEWPATGVAGSETDTPHAKHPHGANHHYAPLAVVRSGQQTAIDCRCTFQTLLCE